MASSRRQRRRRRFVGRHRSPWLGRGPAEDKRWPLHGSPPKRCEPESVRTVAPRVVLLTDSFVIIDKPPDVRMDGIHSDVTVETLTQTWLGLSARWVHRLDYGTSGLLLGALTKEAARRASCAFEMGGASKVYVGVAIGHVAHNEFEMNAAIASTADFRMSVAESVGKPARTLARVVARCFYRSRPVTKLELRPLTGRRHQLRVHLLYIGHPLVGDATYYGGKLADAPRMMLHARKLTVYLPGGDIVQATTPDPFQVDAHGRLRLVPLRVEECSASYVKQVGTPSPQIGCRLAQEITKR